ncbi:MAG TPA: NAD(P)-binding domain-containing protein, partial [Nonomuraea sp.]|nr:NAD(P)-binding domain-containing protein [Nonomuraea sp.]
MAETPVTVIGMGMMGRALATAFMNAGHPTTIFNRTPGKAEAASWSISRQARPT